MLKLSIIFGLLASIVWRTTPTNCRPSPPPTNVNEIMAANVQKFMDLTARPCENFYQYACGHWYQQHIEQLDFGDTLGLLDHSLNLQLEHLLRRLSAGNVTEPPTEPETDIYQKVFTYYRSCKKVKPYNLKKYLLLVPPSHEANWFLLSRNGGKNWPEDQFDWLAVIARLRWYGLNGVLLKEEVLPCWDDAVRNSIYLDKPNLAETQPMGEGVMIELLLDIGQTKRVANEVAREVDTFESQLHKLQQIEDDEGAKEMQLSYLQHFIPQIDWLNYLQQLQGPSIKATSTVIIQNTPYMRALLRLLNGVPRRTLCNYIMLKFLLFLKQQGPAEISKQECISSLRRAMPLATSYIMGAHFYRQRAQNDAQVQRIFTQLQEKFYETVRTNRLQLDQPIVDVLLDKVAGMRLQVGNSPRHEEREYYDAYYARVALEPHNFYANQLSLLRFAVEKSHESLEFNSEIAGNYSADRNETYVLTDWVGSSSSPFYVKPRNLIIVPYGFLQLPVYHLQLHDIFKYSVLGFAIAHELLHGFDSSGIDYNSQGNLMGPSEEIAANQQFMHGLRCMQNELATGSRSLNEKLADYEGFRLVYKTYFNQGNTTTTKKANTSRVNSFALLPQFSAKQLFFISFAQFFCSKEHRSVSSGFLEHAVDELRVFQTLANFEDFSKEFGCERRAKMQSRNRCRLW